MNNITASTQGDTISRSALKEDFKARLENAKRWEENAINRKDYEIAIRAKATSDFIIEVIMTINNAPTVEPQMPREYRQALEVLEHIKERYILVEKSPKDDPNALLVAGQQNETK